MGPSAVLAVAEGLMAPALLSSANSLRGDALRSSRTSNAVRASGSVVVRAATESGGGTRIVGGRKVCRFAILSLGMLSCAVVRRIWQ